MVFNKKTVIVTGAANGIGRAIALTFADEGSTVIIADTDKKAGEKLEKDLQKQNKIAYFIHTDVSDPASVEAMVKSVNNRFGPVHILINNAGISEFKSIFELSVDEWDRIINTNLRGAFLSTRAVAGSMQEAGGGSVINIASTRAIMSEPGSEAYAASKGGLLALTHSLAASLGESKITVNAVSPGWIHTGDYSALREKDHKQHLSQRVGKPEDIARACLFLCNPANSFITGENLVIDGGMTRKMIYEG